MDTKYVVVNRKRAYTPAMMLKMLNSISRKQNGKEYDRADIDKYIRRGHLPAYIGGNAIKEVTIEGTGIKYLELGNSIMIRGRKRHEERITK